MLLANGADVNARDDRIGQTALMVASYAQIPQVVRTLLAHGADVNAEDSHHYTALWWLMCVASPSQEVPSEQLETLRLLLDQHVDVNAKGPSGGTVFGCAAREKNLPLMQALLETGARPLDDEPLMEEAYQSPWSDGARLLLRVLQPFLNGPATACPAYGERAPDTVKRNAVVQGFNPLTAEDFPVAEMDHAWSPDGATRYAFHDEQHGRDALIATATTGTRRLVHHPVEFLQQTARKESQASVKQYQNAQHISPADMAEMEQMAQLFEPTTQQSLSLRRDHFLA